MDEEPEGVTRRKEKGIVGSFLAFLVKMSLNRVDLLFSNVRSGKEGEEYYPLTMNGSVASATQPESQSGDSEDTVFEHDRN